MSNPYWKDKSRWYGGLYSGARAAYHMMSHPTYTTTGTKSKRKSKTFTKTVAPGSYAGRFKKARSLRGRNTAALKYGYVREIENGDKKTSVDCVYAGHGVAVQALLDSFCYAIVRRLFMKAGYSIYNMNDKVQGLEAAGASHALVPDIELWFAFRDISLGTQLSVTKTAIGADQTFADVSANLYTSFLGAFGAGDDQVEVVYVALQRVSGTADHGFLASLQMNDLKVHYKIASSLVIQNQTLGGAVGDTSKDDVTNNPLEGKQYVANGNGVVLRFQDQALTIASGSMFCCDPDKGYFLTDPTTATNYTTEMRSVLRRPAGPQSFVGVNRCSSVRLEPGNIKRSFITAKGRYNANKFLEALGFAPLESSTTFTRTNIGHCKFFAFEKLCRTGEGSNPVKIGIEVNQRYEVWLSETKPLIAIDQRYPS